MLGLGQSWAMRFSLQQQPVKRMLLRLASTSIAPNASVAPATSLPNPLQVQDYFGVHKLFTVKDLFEARVHLGHKASALDPRMRQFVFGTRCGMSIVDLDQTTLLLRQALNFTAHVAYRNGGGHLNKN